MRRDAGLILGLLAGLGLLRAAAPAAAGDLRMDYRFRSPQTVRYRTEVQDSLFPGDGGEAISLYYGFTQSLRPARQKDREGFRLDVSLDSVEAGVDARDPLGRYRRAVLSAELGPGDETLSIAPDGEIRSKNRRLLPFLVSLPPSRAGEDAAWSFSVETDLNKPYKGAVTVSCKCQLLQIDASGGDSLAVLEFRSERSDWAEVSVREPFQTVTSRFETAERGAGALYFNVSRGMMEKGVIRWTGDVIAMTGGIRKSYRKKSRVMFRILKE
jgi:hypothetical protein